MRGQYQGGSLAGFIIIGVVLALVLVGGLYGLNRYNAEQSKEVAIGNKDNSDQKANDSSNKEEPSEPTKDDQSSGESTNEEQANRGSEDSSNSESSSETSGNQLPATGPAETLTTMFGLVTLSFAGAHYLQSRARRN